MARQARPWQTEAAESALQTMHFLHRWGVANLWSDLLLVSLC